MCLCDTQTMLATNSRQRPDTSFVGNVLCVGMLHTPNQAETDRRASGPSDFPTHATRHQESHSASRAVPVVSNATYPP